MDARLRVPLLLLTLLPTLGAAARTRNFIVEAPTPALAQQIAHAAETMRRDLARDWLGHDLPDWSEPCPVVAKVHSSLGAGGRTSFMFRDRVPFGWEMEVQGSQERILDSVLPHEVTHTIFATHFGRPLPRWADEGACTTVEHRSERNKQEQWLVRFLKTERGIPFNQMFAMTEYPGDILPLYSQGYSLARYLIAQGGRPKFVEFVGQGLDSGDWPSAVRAHYGFKSIGALQVAWLDWVVHGSREAAAVAMADRTSPRPAPRVDEQVALVSQKSADGRAAQAALTSAVAPSAKATGKEGGGNWYVRRPLHDRVFTTPTE
jgi:hypothetical protein